MNDHITVDDFEVESLIDRIVTELLSETTFFKYEDGLVSYGDFGSPCLEHPVTKEEILSLPNLSGYSCPGHFEEKNLNGEFLSGEYYLFTKNI